MWTSGSKRIEVSTYVDVSEMTRDVERCLKFFEQVALRCRFRAQEIDPRRSLGDIDTRQYL